MTFKFYPEEKKLPEISFKNELEFDNRQIGGADFRCQSHGELQVSCGSEFKDKNLNTAPFQNSGLALLSKKDAIKLAQFLYEVYLKD